MPRSTNPNQDISNVNSPSISMSRQSQPFMNEALLLSSYTLEDTLAWPPPSPSCEAHSQSLFHPYPPPYTFNNPVSCIASLTLPDPVDTSFGRPSTVSLVEASKVRALGYRFIRFSLEKLTLAIWNRGCVGSTWRDQVQRRIRKLRPGRRSPSTTTSTSPEQSSCQPHRQRMQADASADE